MSVSYTHLDVYKRQRHPQRQQAQKPTLVFTGVMDYWPNIEGVQWFVERVFPRIRAAIPATAFYIVGSRPTTEIKRLERCLLYTSRCV